jgi:hypothetical protein
MLEELQSLSDAKKKHVLVIATIIIMVIIVGVWVAYFNSIIVGTAQQASAEATSTDTAAPASASAPAQASEPGLWQNIENGFGSIANVFRNPSQYNIQPQGN